MTKKLTYWEYEVLFWDPIDSMEETRSGVIPAGNYLEVVSYLKSTFKNLIEIIDILPINGCAIDVAVAE